MNDEDQFLLRLKDDEGLSWKEIATRFEEEMGKSYQVPALQMRLKRLRERMRVWTEGDIHALRLAHEYWMNQKFEIIAAKVCNSQVIITFISSNISIDERVRFN
jgi:hypothetical protein